MKYATIIIILHFALYSSVLAQCPTNPISSGTFDVTGTCAMTDLTVDGTSILNVSGTLSISGTLTFTGDATLNIQGSGELIIGSSGTVSGNGDLVVDGVITVQNGAVLNKIGVAGSISGSGVVLSLGTGTADSDITDEVGNGICYTYDSDECCGSQATCNALLPIILGNFEVNALVSYVELEWQTITEENFDFFSIERSEDGEHFSEIGTVPGHGNSNDPINYSFVDENPLFGMSYYRLNAIDYDGTYEKFQILPVEFLPDELQVSIYPNPGNNNNIMLRLGLPTEAKYKSVSIHSLSGEKVYEKVLAADQNNLDLSSQIQKGFYFAKVQIDNFTTTKKLIIN